MMKRLITAALFLFGYGTIYAQNGAINGWCDKGATTAKTSGLASTTTLQGIVPGGNAGCLVQVYISGTVTPASIFPTISGGTLSNPFRATLSGQWLFFAATSNKYDVVMSGGLPPNAYTTPVTLTGLGSGGGGGSGGPCTGSPTTDINCITTQDVNVEAGTVLNLQGGTNGAAGGDQSTRCFSRRDGRHLYRHLRQQPSPSWLAWGSLHKRSARHNDSGRWHGRHFDRRTIDRPLCSQGTGDHSRYCTAPRGGRDK